MLFVTSIISDTRMCSKYGLLLLEAVLTKHYYQLLQLYSLEYKVPFFIRNIFHLRYYFIFEYFVYFRKYIYLMITRCFLFVCFYLPKLSPFNRSVFEIK